MSAPLEKEEVTLWKSKVNKLIEGTKDIQTKHAPELIKLVQQYQRLMKAQQETGEKIADLWSIIAETIGLDSEWAKCFKDLGEKQRELDRTQPWDEAAQNSFVDPLTIGMEAEVRETLKKEKDVRKAIVKFDTELRSKGGTFRKELKKGLLDANELTTQWETTQKQITEYRDLIAADVERHCQQTYFKLLQAWCMTMKARANNLDAMQQQLEKLKESIGEAVIVKPNKEPEGNLAEAYNPNFSNQLVPDMDKKKKEVMKAKSLSKKDGKKKDKEKRRGSKNNLAPLSSDDGAVRPPASLSEDVFSRPGAARPMTWAPISGGTGNRLEQAINQFGPAGGAADPFAARAIPSVPGSPPPLPPTSSSTECFVKAKWAFNAERQGELSMQVGDVLKVIDKTNKNWWKVELNGQQGNIPFNYVEEIKVEPTLPPPVLPSRAELEPLPAPPAEEELHSEASIPEPPAITPAPVALEFTPPPPPVEDQWIEYKADDGTPYYYNPITGESSWVKP
ncbi:Intersectin-2 [Balamuthia mandrillaris]